MSDYSYQRKPVKEGRIDGRPKNVGVDARGNRVVGLTSAQESALKNTQARENNRRSQMGGQPKRRNGALNQNMAALYEKTLSPVQGPIQPPKNTTTPTPAPTVPTAPRPPLQNAANAGASAPKKSLTDNLMSSLNGQVSQTVDSVTPKQKWAPGREGVKPPLAPTPPAAPKGREGMTLTSKYGKGSVSFGPPGTKPAGDARLRGEIAEIKERQSRGIYEKRTPPIAGAQPPQAVATKLAPPPATSPAASPTAQTPALASALPSRDETRRRGRPV